VRERVFECVSEQVKEEVSQTNRCPALLVVRLRPPALKAGPNRLFRALDLYWRSLESGGLWSQSGHLKKTIDSPSEG
jgi:hypothetical protein